MCIYVRRYRDASAPVGGELKRCVEGVVRLSPQFLRVTVDLPWSVFVVRFLCVFFRWGVRRTCGPDGAFRWTGGFRYEREPQVSPPPPKKK